MTGALFHLPPGRKRASPAARAEAVKDRLAFGDLAMALGLSGSSRAGWHCPACGSPEALKERADRRGARCTACAEGFDALKLKHFMVPEAFGASVAWLEKIADEAERAASGTDLFGGLE